MLGVRRRVARQPDEEKVDFFTQRIGQFMQPAGADAGRARLVFLDLRRRQAQLPRQAFAAQPQPLTRFTQACADNVGR